MDFFDLDKLSDDESSQDMLSAGYYSDSATRKKAPAIQQDA